MYLIKPCPSCGKKIRFPIDKGKIQVKCPCGNSFTADPDDPSIYNDGKIDPAIKPKKSPASFFDKKLKSLNFARIKAKTINGFLEYKYRIQNFPLLPDRQKAAIATQIIGIIIILIVVIVLFSYL